MRRTPEEHVACDTPLEGGRSGWDQAPETRVLCDAPQADAKVARGQRLTCEARDQRRWFLDLMESSVQQMEVGAARSSVLNVRQHTMVVSVRLDP